MIKQKFKKVFLALDTNKLNSAIKIVNLLKNDLAGIKIGKELFSCFGPEIIKKFKKFNLPIFLDLKFHDIPTTVYRTVKTINLIKPNYLSIHSLGGNDMISAAVKASRGIKILSVSLLSHHEQKSINEIGIKNSLKNEIKKLINNALKNNVHGLILAPNFNIIHFGPSCIFTCTYCILFRAILLEQVPGAYWRRPYPRAPFLTVLALTR